MHLTIKRQPVEHQQKRHYMFMVIINMQNKFGTACSNIIGSFHIFKCKTNDFCTEVTWKIMVLCPMAPIKTHIDAESKFYLWFVPSIWHMAQHQRTVNDTKTSQDYKWKFSIPITSNISSVYIQMHGQLS